jgi:hypothetical protein
MTINCENLKGYLSEFSLIKTCDTVKNGSLRLATPFTYPNSSHIDLFLEPKNHLFDSFRLSDYGQTAEYLFELGFDVFATKKRKQIVNDICQSLEIEQGNGEFYVDLDNTLLKDLSSYMVKLSQACIRVADLSFTQRLQNFLTFETEVEEFIVQKDLRYETETELVGRYNNVIKVDFSVKGKSVDSIVQTLSTRNPTNSHIKAIEVFRKWYDLQEYKQRNQFLTIYDSDSVNVRQEDFKRLYEHSTVLGFPQEQEEIAEALAA